MTLAEAAKSEQKSQGERKFVKMALAETLKKAQCEKTCGQSAFDEARESLKARFKAVKERQEERDHPAYADAGETIRMGHREVTLEQEFHCAFDRYSVGCYDFTGHLPKGVPRQRQMDTLFHEIENMPPLGLIEDYIHEAEEWLGEQAMKAKEYAINKLKEVMKNIIDRGKEMLNSLFNMDSVMDKMGGKEIKELIDFLVAIITGKISLKTIVKIIENLIKLILKTIWRTLERMYEPYLQVIMLILWTVNVVVQLLALIADRIAKTMELLSRILSIQIKWPSDQTCRCSMKMCSNPNAEAEAALMDAQADLAYVNGEISTLQLVQERMKSAVKASEAATQKAQDMANEALSQVTGQLQSSLNQVLSKIPIGSISACLAELARITALAANIDKLIDKFAEAVGTVLTLGLNKFLEALDKLGISI